MDFDTFPFDRSIRDGIAAAGYVTPTPIQAMAIPAVLEGRDVLGLAQTGTGKTAAFALPILDRLLKGDRCTQRALILSPTRELAEQTHRAFVKLGAATGMRSMTVYGGVTPKSQVKILKTQLPEIIVACPGRLLDLMGQGVLSLGKIEILVLDEADQMFDMGFLPSIRRIIAALPRARQTLMFSATFPSEIRALAGEFQKNPARIELSSTRPADTVRHAIYAVGQNDKLEMLKAILPPSSAGQALVFTRTKHRAKKLALQLSGAGHETASLQGNLSQGQRDKAMAGFRSGKVRIMVATDIAARGIDVVGISHVINFDIPDTVEAYTHRIGRTGRMLREGTAMTLVTPEDSTVLHAIERKLGVSIERRTVDGFVPATAPGPDFDARPPREARIPREARPSGRARPARASDPAGANASGATRRAAASRPDRPARKAPAARGARLDGDAGRGRTAAHPGAAARRDANGFHPDHRAPARRASEAPHARPTHARRPVDGFSARTGM